MIIRDIPLDTPEYLDANEFLAANLGYSCLGPDSDEDFPTSVLGAYDPDQQFPLVGVASLDLTDSFSILGDGDFLVVRQLAVREDRRRNTIGRQLMDKTFRYAAVLDLDGVCLVSQERSKGFYDRLGFSAISDDGTVRFKEVCA
jgi:GNAT superfamily N-acetyltransferase